MDSERSSERMPMSYVLRPYQKETVEAAVRYLKSGSKYNAIEVLPTGAGKALVIANVAKELGAPTLIFQPSKEILEQNYEKLLSYGYRASIYSACMRQKEVLDITFATIGSVVRKADLFKEFRYIIIDECYCVNSKEGMYSAFLKCIEGARILGLTATPYRLVTDGFGGSILKFLTRTRPRVFRDVIYHVQNRDLFEAGFLAKLRYSSPVNFDRSRLKVNSTGADFDDQSVKNYYRDSKFPDMVVDVITREMGTRRNALVFTRFVEEAEYLVSRVPGTAIVTAETPKTERGKLISGFRSGQIKVICNVGILVLGFDYPELETIIIATPTMSLARYYQMVGRGIRPHPAKKYTEVVDMCGNLKLFGKVEDLRLVNGGNGKWFISSNGRQLTNVYYGQRPQWE
jgi:DNA repair protein RadD